MTNPLLPLFMLTLVAAAPVTRPAQTSATRPSPAQLHQTAYQFLREQQYQKAATPIESAYASQPPMKQPRALLLNHALVDVALKKNAMRAVKDLRDYLAALEGKSDEQAVNLLGAALHVADDDERMPDTELFQSAQKQLGESLRQLDRARPGQRKWGLEWKPDAEFATLDAKRDTSRKAYNLARQELTKRRHAAEQAAAKVEAIAGRGTSGKKKAVAKHDANYAAAERASVAAEKAYADEKAVVEEAKKNLFGPDWSIAAIEPVNPASPATQPAP